MNRKKLQQSKKIYQRYQTFLILVNGMSTKIRENIRSVLSIIEKVPRNALLAGRGDPTRVRDGFGCSDPLPKADVAIKLADTQDPVEVGKSFVYVVKVENRGPNLATGVKAVVRFSRAGVFASPNKCVATPFDFTCTIGNLAKGKTTTFRFFMQAPMDPGNASISGRLQATTLDPQAFNNTASESTTVISPSPNGSGVDLFIHKVADLDPVPPGRPIAYEIVVFNNGPAHATGVVMTDPLPAGVDFISVSATPGGVCEEDAGTVTCEIGAMASGSWVVVDLLATAPIVEGTVLNTASVTSVEPDIDLSDNDSSVAVFVPEPAAALLRLSALGVLAALAVRRRRAR